MKIYMPINPKAKTGKGLFINRMFKRLKNCAVDVDNDLSRSYDIGLHLVKIDKRVKSKKNIVRFDGVYYNTAMDYKKENRIIKKQSSHADGVIFQSEFGERMVRKYVRDFKVPTKIIFNGADPQYFEFISTIHKKYDPIFFAFARWRPHKRLESILKSFLLADIPESCLWIAGDLRMSGLTKRAIKKYFDIPNIRYLGILKFSSLAPYIVAASTVIHLCWLDCCPNSVVESICAKKLVICNNVGGTPEIVKPSGGMICEIDRPYNFKPVDLYNPPKIDINKIVRNMVESVKDNSAILCEHVDIGQICKQYLNFFYDIVK